MNDNSTYYTDLITRYFSGETTEEELLLLSDWLKADPQHQELFNQYQKTWRLLEKHKIDSIMDTDLQWKALQSKMNMVASEIGNPDKVISLNLKKDRFQSSFRKIWKVAAAITILLVSSFLLYFYLSKPATIIVIAQGANLEKQLPDGSVVSLHVGSQITYPEKFSSATRNVELKGEAYFKVAHDKTKPFIVASGDACVKVLGTEFNVNTNTSEGSMEVVLTTGKVSVYYNTRPQEKVLLMPGEKAELISEQKQIRKSPNTDANYMAWKSRVLVFDNETLAQVINTLQNVYQTPIKLADQKLSGCRVTASFNDQSIESVLQVLKETLDLQVKQNKKVIEISGNGCK